jgi:hypothetical protein
MMRILVSPNYCDKQLSMPVRLTGSWNLLSDVQFRNWALSCVR